MANAQSELNILVRLKDEASKSIEGIKGKLESMEPTFRKMAIGGTAAFAGITAIGIKAVKDYAEAEKSAKQLEHATLNVAKGTREQLKALQDVSAELQKKGVLDGDAIQMGQAQLMTFGISADMAGKLSGSLADLAVNQFGVNASGDQLTQTANMIAKALNGQFGVLEKSGIRFTEAQQHMIQYGTETEKASALQEGFAQNLKFTNEVALGTLEGKMAHINVMMGDMSENIGKALAPAFEALLSKLVPVIEKIVAWAEENPKLIATILAVSAGLAGVIAVVGTLGLILPSIIAGFTLLIGPVGIAIATLGFLVLAVHNVVKIYQMLRDDGKLIWEGIKIYMKEAVQWIYDNSIGKLLGYIEKARNALTSLWEAAKNTPSNIGSKVKNFVTAPFSNRATGGQVFAGMPYIVGEQGREIFEPTQDGRIIPNGGMGGGVTNIYLSGNSFIGEEGIIERVSDNIADGLKLSRRLT